MRKLLACFFIIFFSSSCLSQSLSPKVALNASDKVIFYGLTALNNENNDIFGSITATGRFAVQLIPSNTGIFKINLGANLLNANPSGGIKKDSVDFNSLMFPETGNFGFLFNPAVTIKNWPDGNSAHSVTAEGTFAYRKIRLDSPIVNFKILSYNLGLKYQWEYSPSADPNDNFIFTTMVYWNFFNIPDEDVSKFYVVINDPLFVETNKKGEISSVGVKSTIQYREFIFFADIRNNVNTKNLADENPLKGTKFNIGIATRFRIKSF